MKVARGFLRHRFGIAMLGAAIACTACRADHDPAVAAYGRGEFGAALAGFDALARELDDAAPAALFFDQALSALQAGAVVQAEFAMEKAMARGGAQFAPEREFVFGNAAFARCERAEAQASGPEAEPFAFDVAIAHAEAARAAWQSAAIARDDWPQARRNVARAMQKLDDLQRKRSEAVARKRKDQRPDSKPTPTETETRPPRDGEPTVTEAAPRLEPQGVDLAAVQIDALLSRLAEKDREKQALRQRRRSAAQTSVEKDW